jgi:hypothetical protein
VNVEGRKNSLGNGGSNMQTKTNDKVTNFRDTELDEELAGILAAISVVSRRLAKKLLTLQQQDALVKEGGKPDGQDE